MSDNPYASTTASNTPADSTSDSGLVSSAVADQLIRTSVWVKLVSVIFWIGAGFMILGGIGLAAMGATSELRAVGLGSWIGFVYIASAFFYIYPAIKLWKFGSRSKDLAFEPSVSLLIDALDQQRAFWKYVGIVIVLLIVLWILIIVGAAIIGA